MQINNNQVRHHLFDIHPKVRKIVLVIGMAIAALILLNTFATAQSTSDQKKKAQVSFLYPLGSNGTSTAFSHNFSYNMIIGINGGVDGFELGGVGNVNHGEVRGFQLGGVTNYTNGKVEGVQLAGCSNVNIGPTKGFLLSVVNVVEGEMQGMQLGVVNYAKRAKGVQLGIINVMADGQEALPIGLISVVKNGYYALETTGGESLYANLNFKIGVETFYTIFKVGYSSFNEHSIYSYGFGVGSLIHLKDKHSLSVDLSASAIVYDDQWNKVWDDEQNILTRLDLNYRYNLTSRWSLVAGPSLNAYFTKVKVGESFGTLNTPKTIYSSENDSRRTTMWLGFNAGMSFRF
ncbi:MAG: hypothetical protein ABJF11_16180 [Reichenbachiella sp.]|uniref:LA_2272 family surface repeat-containing protein n=1 Tax=Reichenbachiella sp. TaxID=2184521 RepID=UPI0032641029